MYFKFIAGTAFCHMLKALYVQISYICGYPKDNIIVEVFAVIASVLFLFSAEYSLIDRIVDDGTTKKSIKLVSCTAPIFLTAGYAAMLAMSAGNAAKMIACGSMVLPMVFTSYFNMKHFILKEDEVGFLQSSRACNLCAILYYFGSEALMLAEISGVRALSDWICLTVSVTVLALVLSAKSGLKIWKSLISSFL